MNSFKIKILISLLGGLIFSLIFILLALVVPIRNEKADVVFLDKSKGELAQISQAIKGR